MYSVSLEEEIVRHAVGRKRQDGTSYRSLPSRSVAEIADSRYLRGREVEIAALQIGVIPERYVRNMGTFSASDQIRLLSATVAVVGLGGLGGGVTEMLARLGIGFLRLIDGDRFEDSNLNRQLFCTHAAIGESKAQAARNRVREVNPSIEVSPIPEFLTPDNHSSVLSGADAAVDCLDNLKDRFVLEQAARILGIPLVSGALAGSFAQITTIFPEDTGLSLIYGPSGSVSEKGAEVQLGTLAPTALLAASLESAEIVKILLNKTETLRNRLLIVDLLTTHLEVLQLAP
jgi:molybdopterin/thiamine biosynthesis adenylyltransferase